MSRIGDRISSIMEAPTKTQILSGIAIIIAVYAIGLVVGAMLGIRVGSINNAR